MNKDIKVLDLKKGYDENFCLSQEYLDSMPDLQNSEFSDTPIDFVGIRGFHMPLKIRHKHGGTQEVKASIVGQVSLEAEKRGINMSRILRTAYKSKDDVFDCGYLEKVLRDYKKDLDSFDAHILMNFQYRIWQDALRSTKIDEFVDQITGQKVTEEIPEGGWQYYNVTFDVNLDHNGEFKKVMWIDFIYSSACPCSTMLSEHAAVQRGIFGIPHSQRSIARIGIESIDNIWIEDIIDMCRKSLTTETLVFCKRPDEQAFAEKNGAQTKFVEDAIRYLKHEFDQTPEILDYKIICLHAESLHSHDAIAVTTKGLHNSIFNHHVTFGELNDIAAVNAGV